jgi:hypothetical protein
VGCWEECIFWSSEMIILYMSVKSICSLVSFDSELSFWLFVWIIHLLVSRVLMLSTIFVLHSICDFYVHVFYEIGWSMFVFIIIFFWWIFSSSIWSAFLSLLTWRLFYQILRIVIPYCIQFPFAWIFFSFCLSIPPIFVFANEANFL